MRAESPGAKSAAAAHATGWTPPARAEQTLVDEHTSRAAGTSRGQRMGVEGGERDVEPLGCRRVRRTTLYDRVEPQSTGTLA